MKGKQDQYPAWLWQVERPARYVGGEYGTTPPNTNARLTFCLAFPDTYEIGISYPGFQLLFATLCSREDIQCERVYAPWPDAEKALRRAQQPLASIETHRPLSQFDVIGFTLQTELSFTNVLTMLDLGEVSLIAAERSTEEPLVIAGGSVTSNPEPMAEFFDAFALGDGETLVGEICEVVAQCRKEGVTREATVQALAVLEGVYVPALNTPIYERSGRFAGFTPVMGGPQLPVRARKELLTLANTVPCPIVPSLSPTHDNVTVEIMRGCSRGCRFCQAGFISRPVRERAASQVVEALTRAARSSGTPNLSLLSLSSGDYTGIEAVVAGLEAYSQSHHTTINLPSLRLDGFEPAVAARIAAVQPRGLTFAPEVATDHMRRVVNKDIDTDLICRTISSVFRQGWRTVKLYYMVGLPQETLADVEAIAQAVKAVVRTAKAVSPRAQVNVSVNAFVPKPHTPFQWAPQVDLTMVREKLLMLRNKIPARNATYHYHNPQMAVLEDLFARGDRRLGQVVYRAWQGGARFDNWDDCFRWDVWTSAFEATGIKFDAFAIDASDAKARFPWDYIDYGVSRDYLWAEWQKSQKGVFTSDCRKRSRCTLCGACTPGRGHTLLPQKEPENLNLATDNAASTSATLRTLRVRYSKQGPVAFLGHLDVARAMVQTLRRAGISVAMSQGFRPKPRLSFAEAAPCAMKCMAEYLDLTITDTNLSPESLCCHFNQYAPSGLRFDHAAALPASAPKLSRAVHGVEYAICHHSSVLVPSFLPPGLDRALIADEFLQVALSVRAETRSRLPDVLTSFGLAYDDLRSNITRLRLYSLDVNGQLTDIM